MPGNKDLYTNLKEITYDGTGKVKGNCDAELVLKVAVDYYEKQFDKAVIVASDDDYACLVRFLKEKSVFLSLVSPSNKCSYLLRKLNIPIVYLDTKKSKFKWHSLQQKSPHQGQALRGSFP